MSSFVNIPGGYIGNVVMSDGTHRFITPDTNVITPSNIPPPDKKTFLQKVVDKIKGR